MRLWVIAALTSCLAALPPAADASDGDLVRIDGDLGYACFKRERRLHGIYGGADAAYIFNGFWGFRGGYDFADHSSKGLTFRVHQLAVGARYFLDVFEYVPWVDFSPTLYVTSGDEAPVDTGYGFGVGFGVDWLMNQQWSVGFAGRYHRLFGEALFPAYVQLGARLGFRWSFGDPLQP